MDFATVSMIVNFVVMVGGVHHVYLEKMLKKSMEVVVVVQVASGICCSHWVYVVSYTCIHEKRYVNVLIFKKIVTIVW